MLLPASVRIIYGGAFYGCSSLAKVLLREGLTSIKAEAFYHCVSLPEIKLPASLTTIGNLAFHGCTSIQNYQVTYDSNTYTSVDGVLFSKDMSKLVLYPIGNTQEVYKVPNGVETIEESAFNKSSFLKRINLPRTLKSIEYASFNLCSNLEWIMLPNTITDISDSAFSNCNKLLVSVFENSYGESYCIQNSIPYDLIGNEEINQIRQNLYEVGI